MQVDLLFKPLNKREILNLFFTRTSQGVETGICLDDVAFFIGDKLTIKSIKRRLHESLSFFCDKLNRPVINDKHQLL